MAPSESPFNPFLINSAAFFSSSSFWVAQGKARSHGTPHGFLSAKNLSLNFFANSEREPFVAGPPPHDTEAFAVTQDGWKLIQNTALKANDDRGEFELFDIRVDPLNQNNLAARHPDIVERLARDIDKWRRRAEDEQIPSEAGSLDSLSPEDVQRLRSLGYID